MLVPGASLLPELKLAAVPVLSRLLAVEPPVPVPVPVLSAFCVRAPLQPPVPVALVLALAVLPAVPLPHAAALPY